MKKKVILMFMLTVETLQATSLPSRCAVETLPATSLRHFPAFAGDTVWAIVPAGSKRDTLACVVLDREGKGVLAKMPAAPGICFLRSGKKMGGKNMDMAFIRSGKETPEIFGEGEAVHNGSVVFRGSPENDSINIWFARQQLTRERLGFWQEGRPFMKRTILLTGL